MQEFISKEARDIQIDFFISFLLIPLYKYVACDIVLHLLCLQASSVNIA